jgi:hypothetical protein
MVGNLGRVNRGEGVNMYELIGSLPYWVAATPFFFVAIVGYIWIGLRSIVRAYHAKK